MTINNFLPPLYSRCGCDRSLRIVFFLHPTFFSYGPAPSRRRVAVRLNSFFSPHVRYDWRFVDVLLLLKAIALTRFSFIPVPRVSLSLPPILCLRFDVICDRFSFSSFPRKFILMRPLFLLFQETENPPLLFPVQFVYCPLCFFFYFQFQVSIKAVDQSYIVPPPVR